MRILGGLVNFFNFLKQIREKKRYSKIFFALPLGLLGLANKFNSRMRLAEGFFLPFLAAEWLHYRRRAPTGRQPAARGVGVRKPIW